MAAERENAQTSTPADRRLKPVEEMGLQELENLRLILRGGSVIDWRRAHWNDREEVEQFLRLHLVDLNKPGDRALVGRILGEAVEYLRSTFRYRVAEAVAEPEDIRDIFLFASGHHPKYPERYRKIACIVLKVMHVINHLEGRQLMFRTPIADTVLSAMVDEKVTRCVEEMQQLGFPIVEFAGSVKSKNSIITKLIAKRETVAAQIFDRMRYRIITKRREDVLPILEYLTRHLFPFNLVVPSQTENTLISFRKLVERTPELHKYIEDLHLPLRHESVERKQARRSGGNPFSGSTYRVLNFIVDLPLRIDPYLNPEDRLPGRPKTVFELVEIQIVDEDTAIANELGENSHERYKHRQRLKVLRRLSRGLVVPRADRTRTAPEGDKPNGKRGPEKGGNGKA